MPTFDEMSLRADIAAKWGHHGAHIDVFDFMVKEIAALREIVNIAVWPDDVVEDGDRTLLDGRFAPEIVDEFGYPNGGWVGLSPAQAAALKRALKERS